MLGLNIKIILVAILFSLIFVICVFPAISQVEKPSYKVLSANKDAKIEVRSYSSMIVAQVYQSGERAEALKQGFRVLSRYIFGHNKINQQNKLENLSLRDEENQKIPMTAPVQQQKLKTGWMISFIMPSQYQLATLPVPENKKIDLKTIPSQTFLVVQFSGFLSEKNIHWHRDHLMKYVQKNGIKTVGQVKYAFYNPPWTLPFLRQNEVMIQIHS